MSGPVYKRTDKLGYSGCRELARAISKKAFAHLCTEYEAYITSIQQEIYDAYWAYHGVSSKALAKAGIVGQSNVLRGYVQNTTGESMRFELTWSEPQATPYSSFTYESDSLYEALRAAVEVASPHFRKRDALYEALIVQLESKNLKQIEKTWPELVSVWHETFTLNEPVEMTQPFETLLARFLPALPAPTAV